MSDSDVGNDASVWERRGFTGLTVRAWERCGFNADAARDWCDAGVSTPSTAARLRDSGFTPEDVEKLTGELKSGDPWDAVWWLMRFRW